MPPIMQPFCRAAIAEWSAVRHFEVGEAPDQYPWSAPSLRMPLPLMLTESRLRLCIGTGARPFAADAATQCDAPLGWLQELMVVGQCPPVRAKALSDSSCGNILRIKKTISCCCLFYSNPACL